MKDPAVPETDEFYDSAGVICRDHPCESCGYNLRGLSRQGVCPECGVPVARSTTEFFLCFADAAWLRTIAIGTRLMSTAMLLSMMAAVFLGLFAGLQRYESFRRFWGTVGVVCAACILAAGLIGVWLVTVPDPKAGANRRMRRTLRVARILISVGLLWLAGAMGVGLLEDADVPDLVRSLTAVLDGTWQLGLMAASVGFIALLRGLGDLAQRIPSPRLQRDARRLARLAWVVPFGAVSLLLWSTPILSVPGPLLVVGVIGLCAAGVSFLVYIICAAVMSDFAVELRRICRSAKAKPRGN